MSLRTRLTVFVAGSVALAVLAVSAVGWFAARRELRGEVDDALRARVRAVAAAATPLDRAWKNGSASTRSERSTRSSR